MLTWLGAGKTSFGIDIRQHSSAHKHRVRSEHKTGNYERRLRRRLFDISASQSNDNR